MLELPGGTSSSLSVWGLWCSMGTCSLLWTHTWGQVPAAKLYTARVSVKTELPLQTAVPCGTDAFAFTLLLDWGVGRGTFTLGITKTTLHNGGLLRSVCVHASPPFTFSCEVGGVSAAGTD